MIGHLSKKYDNLHIKYKVIKTKLLPPSQIVGPVLLFGMSQN